MRLAITGHRPDRLTKDLNALVDAIRDAYVQLQPTYIYEGQAPGGDLAAACAAAWQEIPYEAVMPWAGHRDSIPTHWQQDYDFAILGAERVEVLSDSLTYPGAWVYHNRNKYMVDHADSVLAIWDRQSGGGTAATVLYAHQRNKGIHVIDPHTLEYSVAG